jgi:hypothetical protein
VTKKVLNIEIIDMLLKFIFEERQRIFASKTLILSLPFSTAAQNGVATIRVGCSGSYKKMVSPR